MSRLILGLAIVVGMGAAIVLAGAAGGCNGDQASMGCCAGRGNHSAHQPAGGHHDADKPAAPASDAAAPKIVNTRCPIMGGAVNPSLTRQHRGQTVAFCCGGCPAQWDKLSDAEKDAKLAAVADK